MVAVPGDRMAAPDRVSAAPARSVPRRFDPPLVALCWVLAIVFGWRAIARIRVADPPVRGRGLAVAGLWLGVVQLLAMVGLAVLLAALCNRPDATCFELTF